MLYPAQTSMMPVNVALAGFLETNGLGAIFSNYPYWYLGSTPFRFLTGPILPLLLSTIHRLVPDLSLFEIMFGLLGVAWLIGGVGVYLLVAALANSSTSEESLRATVRGVPLARFPAILAAFFYLFGPIIPLLFPFSDGVYLLAFSALPFILFCYLKFLKKPELKLKIFLIFLITFVLLLDTLIIPSLFLGMTAIFLAQVGWKKAEAKLKKSLWLIAYSLLLATLWYAPGYWWTILTAPSFGGKGLGQVIVWLGKLMPVALALTLAVFSARFFKKRDLLRDFCFFWLFIFGFLTLVRFLSDWDFWQDWSSYAIELQMGLAISGGMMLGRWMMRANEKRMKIMLIYANVLMVFIIWLLIFNKYTLGTLQKDITQTVEYRVGKWLSENAKPGERPVKSDDTSDHGASVFLSGTTAFWLNAFFDVPQVRGGRDQASLNPNWRQAAWEIRDGSTGSPQEVQKSVDWLKKLGVFYLVVHTEESEEYWHDFKYPEKFEAAKGLKKVFSDHDSTIYRVEE